MKTAVLFTFLCLFSLVNSIPSATFVSGNLTTNVYGVYSGSVYPGSRRNANQFYDASGNYWMMAGYGCGSSSIGELNDMWKFTISTNQWSFIGGASNPGGSATYNGETLASNQWPTGRDGAAGWYDSTDDLFLLFGGNSGSYMGNDMWAWNFTDFNLRTPCCCGPICGNHSAVYPPNAVNGPGARAYSTAWLDNRGNAILFGGQGFDVNGKLGLLNDIWSYKISTAIWTFIGGNMTANAPSFTSGKYQWPSSRDSSSGWFNPNDGSYWLFGGYANGALADMWKIINLCPCPCCNLTFVPKPNAVSNWPSARYGSSPWSDSTGNNRFLFGGYDDTGFLNDLWMWNGTTPGFNQLSSGATSGWPGPRYYGTGWTDGSSNFYLFSGYGTYSSESGELNDMWKLVV